MCNVDGRTSQEKRGNRLKMHRGKSFIKKSWHFPTIFSYCHHFSSVVRPSTLHILIFSSKTTGPIATKLWGE
jgi:hypothetical protein